MVKNILTILRYIIKLIKLSKLNKSLFPPGRSEIIYNKKNKIIIIDYVIQKMHMKTY